jgi:hypothetical protein
MVATGEGLERLPEIPPAAEWVRYYRRRRHLEAFIIDSWFPAQEGSPKASAIWRTISRESYRLSKLGVEQRKAAISAALGDTSDDEVKKVWEESAAMWQAVIGDQEESTRREYMEDWDLDEDAKLATLVPSPEVQFLMRVVIPCWLLHGEEPGRLFHRARTGDLDALEKLLRLDKAVICDPMIANEFHQAATSSKQRARFRRLAAAYSKFPRKPTARRTKVALASLVSKFAQAIGVKLTAPELQSLFDAAAIATSRGKQRRDLDLNGEPETFSREVRMDRKRWKILPEKNSGETTPGEQG